jgi:hypothetical protein
MGRSEDVEFLRFDSSLTPALCATATLTIANGLYVAFEWPKVWTALVVAFLFGAGVLARNTGPLWQRLVLWPINSLVVFGLVTGGNSLGGLATGAESRTGVVTLVPSEGSPAADVAPTATPSTTPAPPPRNEVAVAGRNGAHIVVDRRVLEALAAGKSVPVSNGAPNALTVRVVEPRRRFFDPMW